MKAGDVVGGILDPLQLFYKPSGTKKASGADGAKDKDNVSSQFGPVTQLLVAAPGPVNTIVGGILGKK